MKHRDVFLDFTSLLDIILIILFFFILFSTFDSEKYIMDMQTEYEAKYEEMVDDFKMKEEELIEELNTELDHVQDEKDRIQEELNLLQKIDENAAKKALIAFNNGFMLSFSLQKSDNSEEWQLSAVRKSPETEEEESVGIIKPGEYEDLSDAILKIFETAGFDDSEVLIVTFTYDGNVIGTHRLYVEIMDAFHNVQSVRKNTYLNAVNISK